MSVTRIVTHCVIVTLGQICAEVRVECVSRVRTQSVNGSKFDLRLRSGLCFESRSKLILCPRVRVVHAANSQEFTTFWLTLWARPCASQCLWKCQDIVFSLPFFVEASDQVLPGDQCACLFGGTAAVRMKILVGVISPLGNIRSTQGPDASTT